MKNVKYDADHIDDDISLDLTPLIDVIFMLVIFFVLTTSFIKPIMDVALPSSKTAESKSLEQQHTITVVIDKMGNYYLELKQNQQEQGAKQPVTIEQITQEVSEKISSTATHDPKAPPITLNVIADKDAPMQSFIALADLAKEYLAGRMTLSTEKKHATK